MNARLLPTIVLALTGGVLLSACTFTTTVGGPPTASSTEIATTAATALEKQVGSRPLMDCGNTTVDLVVGTVVDCVLTDPATGQKYQAPVTIKKVEGVNYTVGVKVADTPIG